MAAVKSPVPGKVREKAREKAGDKSTGSPDKVAGKVATRRLTGKEVDAFYAALAAAMPEPKGELHYVNPYTLLVAVALSAQATDKGVNKATEPLFARVDTPWKMVELGEEGLREAIKTIGLFNSKARNVMEMSRLLIERHNGEVPVDRAALEALPGVGRKTANVVLNIAFGQPTMAVDTHVFRISNRSGLAPGKTVRAVEDLLVKVTPPAWALHAHHWLILHGRYVCKARKPDCPDCVVKTLCRYPDKTAAAAAGPSTTAGRASAKALDK